MLNEILCKNSFQIIQNCINDAVFILDTSLPLPKIVDCNEASSIIFGYRREEMVGEPIGFLHVNNESIEKFQLRLHTSLDEDRLPFIYEYRMKRKDGSVFPSKHIVNEILDKQKRRVGWVSIIRDISELENFRNLVKNSFDIIYTMDIAGRITYASPSIKRILGYAPKEVIGRNAQNFLMKPESYKFTQSLDKVMKGKSFENLQIDILNKNGFSVPLEVNGCPLLINGRVVGVEGVVRNIRERRKSEQIQKKYLEQIEKAVKEKTLEIRKLNKEFSRSLAERTQQIINLSHIKEQIKKAPDVSSGLDLILDSVLKDFEMDVGLIFLIGDKESALELRAFQSNSIDNRIDESYSLTTDLIELDALKEKRSFSKEVKKDTQSILKTSSIHCAPIYYGKSVQGIIALGSMKRKLLDNSELNVLELYANLITTLLMSHSLRIVPVKEKIASSKGHYSLEFGNSYLFFNNVEKAYKVFVDYAFNGVQGLCITREYPLKVREQFGLKKTPIVWLTANKYNDQMTVHSVQDLSILINKFLEKTRNSIILLDGIEYLIYTFGFESTIHFLHLTKDRCDSNNSILIVPLITDSIDKQQSKLLERELKNLKIE